MGIKFLCVLMDIYKCIDAEECQNFHFERREIQLWNEEGEEEPCVTHFELEVSIWNHFILAVQ